MKEHITPWKRTKKFEADSFYVAPVSKALGTRFELKKFGASQVAVPVRLQCKLSYISILQTLRSLFANECFLQTYLKYNEHGGNGHKCKAGEYIDFCCSKIYQNSELYKTYKNSLQIQLYQDDFEVCVPIGSKATIHKLCGIYFTIRNWPNNSRLDHIYLVALCNTDDVKTESTDFNNLWQIIFGEFKVLEEEGIAVTETLTLRGSLTNICADNAGANQYLGFAEGFNASYFCRICELPKDICKTACEEDDSELRTLAKYANSLQVLKKCAKVDYKQTKGIKTDCVLNKLTNFHVVKNYCMDSMHDIPEGVILFLLQHILNYCIENKIFTESALVAKIQYFDFGRLHQKVVPSNLMLNKHSLNQNASQSMCLFHHIPFILRDYEDRLKPIWDCMISLKKIVQILYSKKLTETDITVLRRAVSDHLFAIQKNFGVKLLPKHHNLTHYATVIRAIGPLECHTTIRFEAKHQTFKQIAKNNKNFKDIPKTLATKHQKRLTRAAKNFSHIEKIKASGKKVYESNLIELKDYESIYEINFLMIDDRRFENGLFIVNNNTMHEICAVLESASEFLLLIKKYNFITFNEFLYSYEIQESSPVINSVIDFSLFKNSTLYEKKIVGQKLYIIADVLEIQHEFETFMNNNL